MGKIILTKLFSKNKQMEGTKYMEDAIYPLIAHRRRETVPYQVHEDLSCRSSSRGFLGITEGANRSRYCFQPDIWADCRPSHGTGNERQGRRLLQVHCWRAFHHNRELVGFHLNSEWTPWSGQRRHELDLGIQSFQASAQGDECKSSWYIQLSQFCYL